MKLSALPYYGGKSALATNQTGRWIVRMLPKVVKNQTYIEPFAGMLGVLLQRPPVKVEIANDLDDNVVNWFRVVRDHGEKLAEKLLLTPTAETELTRSFEPTDDPIERARRFTVTLTSSFNRVENNFRWYVKYHPYDVQKYSRVVMSLIDRLSKVYFLSRPAEKVLTKTVDIDTAVIYCDPPYLGSDTRPYGDLTFDRILFTEVIQQHKGAVAISGYNDEWDHLGWVRNEREAKTEGIGIGNVTEKTRTEVLWTNYQPGISLDLFGGP